MVVSSKFSHFAVSAIFLIGIFANAQDAPSLGDLARQQRAQKEQSKAAQAKDSKSTKVITNEELPEHGSTSAASPAANDVNQTNSASAADASKQSAEQWKSQIGDQKNQIASLQKQIDDLNGSIQFAPGNCVENCVQWNQNQQEKQQQVERMRGDLQEQKSHLEQMQESARSQGYGSSVWDP
jgi:chromosome segregation ATPase